MGKRSKKENTNNINLFHFVFVDKFFRFSNHMLKLILFSLCKYINCKIKVLTDIFVHCYRYANKILNLLLNSQRIY